MSFAKPRIRAPQDFTAGLLLIAVAVIALWQSSELSLGSLRQFGPGMMPRLLSFGVGGFGLALVILALLRDGEKLQGWSLRGPLFVLSAVVIFGLTVRPLGLAVAGPLVIIIGGFASSESRLGESAIFAVVMTVFCLLLFKVVLTLPIPVAPWLIGY